MKTLKTALILVAATTVAAPGDAADGPTISDLFRKVDPAVVEIATGKSRFGISDLHRRPHRHRLPRGAGGGRGFGPLCHGRCGHRPRHQFKPECRCRVDPSGIGARGHCSGRTWRFRYRQGRRSGLCHWRPLRNRSFADGGSRQRTPHPEPALRRIRTGRDPADRRRHQPGPSASSATSFRPAAAFRA